jgi:hypothetical protein
MSAGRREFLPNINGFIQEVPITVIYYEFGQKFLGGIRILRDLFLARLNK